MYVALEEGQLRWRSGSGVKRQRTVCAKGAAEWNCARKGAGEFTLCRQR